MYKNISLLITIIAITLCGCGYEPQPTESIPTTNISYQTDTDTAKGGYRLVQPAPAMIPVETPANAISDEPAVTGDKDTEETSTETPEKEFTEISFTLSANDTATETPVQEKTSAQEEAPAEELSVPVFTDYAAEYDRRIYDMENEKQRQLHSYCDSVADGWDFVGFEETGDITINDLSDYYRYSYHFGQPGNAGYAVCNFGSDNIIDETILREVNTAEDRDYLINRMVSTYGLEIGENDHDTVIRTARRVHEQMTYAGNYEDASMRQCLDAGKGVCWTMAQIYKVLLTLEGIPTRTVTGDCQGTGHMWIEVYIDGYWQTVETTFPEPEDTFVTADMIGDYVAEYKS